MQGGSPTPTRVVLVSQDAGVEHTGGGVQGVHRRVDAQLCRGGGAAQTSVISSTSRMGAHVSRKNGSLATDESECLGDTSKCAEDPTVPCGSSCTAQVRY